MSKPGPKCNLIEGQEVDINKMFYRDYMVEFFDEKIIMLVNLLNETKEFVEKIKSKELTIENLKFKPKSNCNIGKLEKYAKCELVDTYYHCLETFIRLFIAHASFEACPLIELTSLDIRGYHKKIDQIAVGNFSGLNNKYNEDDTILLTLIGCTKESGVVSEKQLQNLKSWIIHCANELKNMSEYNSFKHGLSMFAGFGSIKMENPLTGEVIEKSGDAIHILESKEEEKQYKFNLKNIFVEYDFKVALVIFYNELIYNIIQVGNYRYVEDVKKPEIKGMNFAEYGYFDLRDMFYKKDNIGSLMDSYGISLFYTDDLEAMEENN